jgi:hypothetical protein
MKVPTDATKVYTAISRAGTDINPTTISGVGFTPDSAIVKARDTTRVFDWVDRLRGNQYLQTTNANAENGSSLIFPANPWDLQQGIKVGASTDVNATPYNYINYFFGRAPSFFDVLCYTGDGTGTARQINHNLGVIPELYIFKGRNSAGYNWNVDALPTFGVNGGNINTTNAFTNYEFVSSGTSSYFTTYQENDSGINYIAYLFATCPGVSKVGSYTGNGSTQTINCGFTGGARFVLIKRTDDVGDWYIYDTARGMTTLTDPYLRLNSTAAETATLGSVTTVSTGFAVNASVLAAINTNAATYIFLAIA